MLKPAKTTERGVALFFAIFALLVVTALTAALVLLATTETNINSNYRSEEIAFFAAKGGMEEIMDRMMTSSSQTPLITPPSALPSSSGGVIYLINPGSAAASSVQPWNYSNAYADLEFCHDYSGISSLSLETTPPDVPCTGSAGLPSGTTWYASVTSNSPWNGTAAALPWIWARVAMKVNGSETYLSGGTQPTVSTYSVNSTISATSPICWNGSTELVLPSSYATCSAWSSGMTPVFLVTALAVTPTGTRKMVQGDIAATPIPTMQYGLFSTSTACGSTSALTMTGNASTDSYSSVNGAYGAGNSSETGGDVGTNGGISMTGNASIGGSVGVQNPNAGIGTCGGNAAVGPDLSTSGNAGIYSGSGDPSHQDKMTCLQTSPGAPCSAGPISFAAPPVPSPLPPTSSCCSGSSLVPGNYGNISLSGNTTLTLAPGIYNINSLSMSGNSKIVISPVGQVTLNVAGQGTTSAVTLSGNANNEGTNPIPDNFLINYAGTGTVQVTGNGAVYTVINAPNATLDFTGNGAIYGAAIGSVLSYTGNAAFHFDRSIQLQNSAQAGYYNRIGYRELPY